MKSFLASARAGNGLDRVDRDVDLLEEQWQRHGEVSLERFWENCKAKDTGSLLDRLAHLVALIKVRSTLPFRTRPDSGGCPLPRPLSRSSPGSQPCHQPDLRGVLPARGKG